MNKQEHIEYWKTTAEHDLQTAESLFQSARYDACLFFGHLVIEKSLKALWVKSKTDNSTPPKTHNLLKIAVDGNVQLTVEQKEFLSVIEDFNLETRYPDYRLNFLQALQ